MTTTQFDKEPDNISEREISTLIEAYCTAKGIKHVKEYPLKLSASPNTERVDYLLYLPGIDGRVAPVGVEIKRGTLSEVIHGIGQTLLYYTHLNYAALLVSQKSISSASLIWSMSNLPIGLMYFDTRKGFVWVFKPVRNPRPIKIPLDFPLFTKKPKADRIDNLYDVILSKIGRGIEKEKLLFQVCNMKKRRGGEFEYQQGKMGHCSVATFYRAIKRMRLNSLIFQKKRGNKYYLYKVD
jgi:hypothetical protein